MKIFTCKYENNLNYSNNVYNVNNDCDSILNFYKVHI